MPRKPVARIKLPRFDYGTVCDYPGCGRTIGPKRAIWSWADKHGRMRTRCRKHLKVK